MLPLRYKGLHVKELAGSARLLSRVCNFRSGASPQFSSEASWAEIEGSRPSRGFGMYVPSDVSHVAHLSASSACAGRKGFTTGAARAIVEARQDVIQIAVSGHRLITYKAFAGARFHANVNSQPPAIAAIIRKGSSPLATAIGRGSSKE